MEEFGTPNGKLYREIDNDDNFEFVDEAIPLISGTSTNLDISENAGR